MYAKVSGGTLIRFPYTFGDLRRDNPNVSFPKDIGTTTMNRYGMVSVREGTKPDITTYQILERNSLPTRPVTGQDEDGNDIHANYWQIDYTVTDMTEEQRTQKDVDTATANRATRDAKLAETDFYALSDVTMSDAMTTYRQALRDITDHSNWPNLTDEDWPTAP